MEVNDLISKVRKDGYITITEGTRSSSKQIANKVIEEAKKRYDYVFELRVNTLGYTVIDED